MNMNKKMVCAAVLCAFGIGAGVSAWAVTSAEPETSYDRFKARVAAIQEKYPEARKEVVPEIGQNAPLGSGVKNNTVEEKVAEADAAPITNALGMPKLSKIVNLNVSSVRAVAGEGGPILYVADNGRFVIAGRMIDVWQQKELKTMEDIENAVSRVSLDSMGYDKTQYSSFKIGNGEKRVVTFIDPFCGWCHKVVEEVLKSDELKKNYTFIFHAVPVLGGGSQPYAKKLWCSVAKDEDKAQAMLRGQDAMNSLPSKAECDTDSHDRSIYLSKLIGVKAVPFLIAPDGRFHQGKPADLSAFLAGNKK